MTQTTHAFNDSLKLTKTSSPELPATYAGEVGPQPTTDAQPCVVIEISVAQQVEQLPNGFTSIDTIAERFEQAPETKKAMVRARQWLARHKDEGPTLRTLRLRKGWSQATLGKKVGMTQAHIARLESGKCDAQLTTVARLADALGVNPKTLFDVILKSQRLTG